MSEDKVKKIKTTKPKETIKTKVKTSKVKEKNDSTEKVTSTAESTPKVSTEKFLKDFNWHNYEEGIDPIDDKKLVEFESLVKENFVDTLTDEVVEGIVVNLSDRDAIIDINAKSEGVISLNEFRYNPDLKVGDKVEVLIDVREDATGQLLLSHRKACKGNYKES
jgi:small subunit ribosomal protein S1